MKVDDDYPFMSLQPAVEIVTHWRNEASIEQLGENQDVNWKPDSTMIVIRVCFLQYIS